MKQVWGILEVESSIIIIGSNLLTTSTQPDREGTKLAERDPVSH